MEDKLNCKNCKNRNTENCKCELEFTKCGTVFDHTIEVMKGLPEYTSFNIQMAALLHDIGKTEKTRTIRGKHKISFINHEKLGKFMARKRLVDLKFDIKSINLIMNLIEHHMDIHRLAKVSDKAVRRFLRECESFMEDLFVLVDADCYGTKCLNSEHMYVSCPSHDLIKIRAREINEEMKKLSEKPFRYFDGNELMQIFSIDKPCKKVGELINIQNAIIDEFGFDLTKEQALKHIKERYIK